MQPTPPAVADAAPAHRERVVAICAWAAVVLALYAFLLTMAFYEPLTGDGWNYAHARSHTVGSMIKDMIELHNGGNPRFGQAFTILAYGEGNPFHLIFTPLMTLLLLVMVFCHALGRVPRLDSSRDLALFLTGAALCWLATPAPGQAYFYRPITTNYIYTLAIGLLLLFPFRRWPTLRGGATSIAGIAMAVVGFPLWMALGKMNEHTGPTFIAVAALCTALAYRRRDFGNVCWMASATTALLIGFLYLFLAPGQSVRNKGLGRQSVLETIMLRGFRGNVELAGTFCQYAAPMLLFVLLIALVFALARRDDEPAPGDARASYWAIAGYTGIAAMIAGTSFASPIHHYRLFIAPAVLLSIAGLCAIDRMSHGRIVRAVLWPAAVAVNLGFAVILFGVFSELHTDEMARVALMRAAKPGQKVVVPPLRHAKADAYFYGDSLFADSHHKPRLAHLYRLNENDIKLDRSAEPAQKKPPKSGRKKKQ